MFIMYTYISHMYACMYILLYTTAEFSFFFFRKLKSKIQQAYHIFHSSYSIRILITYVYMDVKNIAINCPKTQFLLPYSSSPSFIYIYMYVYMFYVRIFFFKFNSYLTWPIFLHICHPTTNFYKIFCPVQTNKHTHALLKNENKKHVPFRLCMYSCIFYFFVKNKVK